MQKTLREKAGCHGVGLHSGAPVKMTLHPAAEDTGIVFLRSDLRNTRREIGALWDHVVDTRLCTVIANDAGASVGTVEHLMAALRGCGIDNALIELNGPEVPIMDGSSAEFVQIIREAGTVRQSKTRRVLRIRKEISVTQGDKKVTLSPADQPAFSGAIDFSHPSIGSQSYEMALVNGNFVHDLADCRTFGFLHEVEYMRAQGLARGGSLDNAIVLDEQGIMNEDGLRRSDEFIRHKLLDAIGDLYLAGAPILGAYHGVRAGHALNNAVLHKLFETPGAFETLYMRDSDAAPLPRFGRAEQQRMHAV